MHGYEAIVGPVRGMYNAAAGGKSPRGHSLLVHERPNYVTILTLGKMDISVVTKLYQILAFEVKEVFLQRTNWNSSLSS